MDQKVSLQPSAEAQAVMACIDTFEQADDVTRADLREFLKDVPPEFRLAALVELVKRDFERRCNLGQRCQVEQYLNQYSELGESGAAVLDLLHKQFDVRQQNSEDSDADEDRTVVPPAVPFNASDTGDVNLETTPYAGLVAEPTPARFPRIGKYVIVKELGSGGFGVVYLAYDPQLEVHVAIKIRRGEPSQAGLSPDLLHEARTLIHLDHPGIVKLFNVGETDERIGYVVYQYIEGETLQKHIERGDYDRVQGTEWTAKVAEALNYAHQHDIFHRDIKPANILIDGNGDPKIVDFGLARRDAKFFADDANQRVGTAAYMSPEQAKGKSNWASSQSDLYSLGVVLYELICRQRPFRSNRLNALLEEVQDRPVPPPRSIDGSISKQLEDVCLKALSKDPALRYRTGADMAAAVRAAVEPRKAILTTWVRAVAWLTATAALCVLIISLWNALSRYPVPEPPAPTFRAFGVYLDGEKLKGDRPLNRSDQIEVQARFSRPAFAYLFKYEQDGVGELLWPSLNALKDHAKVPMLTRQDLILPDKDGASFIVAVVAPKRLGESEIARLCNTRLPLSVSPKEAAQERPYHWPVRSRENAEMLEFDPPVERGPGRGRLRVPDEFKERLEGTVTAFGGMLVSHEKETKQAEK